MQISPKVVQKITFGHYLYMSIVLMRSFFLKVKYVKRFDLYTKNLSAVSKLITQTTYLYDTIVR